MKPSRPLLWGCLLALLAGCGQPSDDVLALEPATGSEELFEDIVIRLKANGEVEQSRQFVTRAEREAQAATRQAQQEAMRDGVVRPQILPVILDCNNPNALWLYSNPDFTGSRLCLNRDGADGIGVLDLSKTVYAWLNQIPILFWNGRVRSLWAGAEGGNLAQCDLVRNLCYSGTAPYVGFTPGRRVPNIPADTRLNTAWLSIYASIASEPR
jgi:hypothetical protein